MHPWILPLVLWYPFCFSFVYLFVLYACENCTIRRWSINRLKAKQSAEPSATTTDCLQSWLSVLPPAASKTEAKNCGRKWYLETTKEVTFCLLQQRNKHVQVQFGWALFLIAVPENKPQIYDVAWSYVTLWFWFPNFHRSLCEMFWRWNRHAWIVIFFQDWN